MNVLTAIRIVSRPIFSLGRECALIDCPFTWTAGVVESEIQRHSAFIAALRICKVCMYGLGEGKESGSRMKDEASRDLRRT